MQTFLKANFSELWIKLTSNEVLGILDSGYLEDYYGTDGQVSLYYEATGDRTAVLMGEVLSETPDLPHDVFRGVVEISDLPNGVYQIQGRVRDILSQYTVLNDVESPLGGERVISLTFKVTESNIIIAFPEVLAIQLGVSFTMGMMLQQGFGAGIKSNETFSEVAVPLSGTFVSSIIGQQNFAVKIEETANG
jgi:hypothetical protein